MTVYHGFGPHVLSANVHGTAAGARGLALGFDLFEVEGQGWVADLSWLHVKDAILAAESVGFMVHQEGALVAEMLEQLEVPLGPLRPDYAYAFGVFPVSRAEAALWRGTSLGWMWLVERGDRFPLEITKPSSDFADFAAYLLFYDEGLGGDPETLLATLTGYDNNRYSTAALTPGTYKFAAKYSDFVGNLTAVGATFTATIVPLPKAPDNPALAYSSGTQKATLSADEPAGQYAHCVGYSIISNNIIGHGLQERIIEGRAHRAGFTTAGGGVMSWLSPELHAGTWRFAMRGLDNQGRESGFTEFAITLVNSGGNLVEVDAPPATPYFLDAEPLAAGRIRVDVKHDGVDLDELRLYRDAVLVQQANTNGSGFSVDGAAGYVDATTATDYLNDLRAGKFALLSIFDAGAVGAGDRIFSAEGNGDASTPALQRGTVADSVRFLWTGATGLDEQWTGATEGVPHTWLGVFSVATPGFWGYVDGADEQADAALAGLDAADTTNVRLGAAADDAGSKFTGDLGAFFILDLSAVTTVDQTWAAALAAALTAAVASYGYDPHRIRDALLLYDQNITGRYWALDEAVSGATAIFRLKAETGDIDAQAGGTTTASGVANNALASVPNLLDHSFYTGPLTHDQVYAFTARGLNGVTEGPDSEEIEATADAQAPGGTRVITGGLAI